MGKIIAICGKICSGKTYYANRIKLKEGAIILSIDEVTFDLIKNEQDDFYDIFADRVKKYLRKKASELVNIGCNVILDWGFWSKIEREEITNYFNKCGICVEWHYIDVEQSRWKKQIEERNQKIKEGNGGYNFYLDENLMKKMLSRFEEPSVKDIDVWYINN